MKIQEQFRRFIELLAASILIALQIFVYYLIWIKYYNPYLVTPLFRKGYWPLLLIYGLLLFFVGKLYGGYRIGYHKKSDVLYSQVLELIIVNTISYLQACLLSMKLVKVWPILIALVIDFVLAAIWVAAFGKLYGYLYPPKRMLLLHGERPIEDLLEKIHTRKDKYIIIAQERASDNWKNILKYTRDYDAVMICDIPAERRNDIVKYCYGHSIRTYILPKLSDILLMGTEGINLFDTPVLLLRSDGFSLGQRIIKRMMDIFLSCLGILIFSPFMIITAVAVKLYDRGPVFYKQERLTRDGKHFFIYKFRSMVVDAEKDGVARLAAEHDERITKVGRIIRMIRMDELPQLFNVLLGQMSFVGPRPERPEIHEEYLKDMPEFAFRLKVKAGLTGYAQVHGKYNTTAYDKLKLDLNYIENYSVWRDIKLIILTTKILFQKESTEGVKKDFRKKGRTMK